MPSLRQLLAAHSPLLLLDAASARVQVGVFDAGPASNLPLSPFPARWQTSDEEAGIGVFRGIEALEVDLNAVRGFVFCEGPGSVLGIRTVAMALRTWSVVAPRPIFAYCSLAVVAESLGRREIAVIADARRDAWHHFQLGGTLRRVPTAGLAGELVMPENFRHWSQSPPNLTRVPYSLADLLPRVADADLFRPTDAPDAFLHEEPNYAAWTPQIHRAPAPR